LLEGPQPAEERPLFGGLSLSCGRLRDRARVSFGRAL